MSTLNFVTDKIKVDKRLFQETEPCIFLHVSYILSRSERLDYSAMRKFSNKK